MDSHLQDEVENPVGIEVKIANQRLHILDHMVRARFIDEGVTLIKFRNDFRITFALFTKEVELLLRKIKFRAHTNFHLLKKSHQSSIAFTPILFFVIFLNILNVFNVTF